MLKRTAEMELAPQATEGPYAKPESYNESASLFDITAGSSCILLIFIVLQDAVDVFFPSCNSF